MAEPLDTPPIVSRPTPPSFAMCALVYPNTTAQYYVLPDGTPYDPADPDASGIPGTDLMLRWTSDAPQRVCRTSW